MKIKGELSSFKKKKKEKIVCYSQFPRENCLAMQSSTAKHQGQSGGRKNKRKVMGKSLYSYFPKKCKAREGKQV